MAQSEGKCATGLGCAMVGGKSPTRFVRYTTDSSMGELTRYLRSL
jgi:hypothetical protein